MNKTAWIDVIAHTTAADVWVFVVCLVGLIAGLIWTSKD